MGSMLQYIYNYIAYMDPMGLHFNDVKFGSFR